MDKRMTEKVEDIVVPVFTPKQVLKAMEHTGVYLFKYFPQTKMCVMNERTSRKFNCKRIYYDMPESFGNDFVYDEDRAHYEAMYKKINSGEEAASSEFRSKSGNTWCKVRMTTVEWDEDGKPQLCAGIVEDCSYSRNRERELLVLQKEQERVSALLRREKKRYREALIANSEYLFDFDVTEGLLQVDFRYTWNDSLMTKRFGLALPVGYDEMMRRWVEVTEPQFLTSESYSYLTCGELLKKYQQGTTHIDMEYYIPSEDRYLRNVILLSEDEGNGHVMAVIYAVDITENVREETRKRNELLLKNQELQKQVEITKSFSSIYFGSWEVDLTKCRIEEIEVPEWAHNIVADSKGNFIKAMDIMRNSFVHEDTWSEFNKLTDYSTMADRLRGDSIISCEYQTKQYGWCEADLIPMKWDDEYNVLRAIFAVRGINAQKQLELDAKQALQEAYENARRANVAKTEFLSSMSHDMRTPMNAIIGMTAIAGTHLDDKERVADCLSKITISSKHLLGLINDVLDMNKIESGKMNLSAEAFSLSELVDNLLTMSKPQIEERKHQLNVSIQGVEHENVIGDSQRIQQIFMNLMGNAVKYTPEGGKISLSIQERSTNRPKIGCYEFVFEDNGIGMSKEFLLTIFEPFARAKDSRVEKVQGTGLGMAITKNIISMMNGDIKVESELDKGTKITVTIFLEIQDTDVEQSVEEFVDLPVLVVDDEQTACEYACEMLDGLGMKGEWVLTGREALEWVCKKHEADEDYFAVIMDWKMPEMDGLATTKEMRRRVGEKVPIIIISAYDWSDIEFEARAAGANAFISKPLFKSRVIHLFKSMMGDGEAPIEAASLEHFAKRDFSDKRALLVEDNELNAEIAGEILGMVKLNVDYANDGNNAVEIMENAEEGYYDIIFMDIRMPFMNGYEATRAIRNLPRKDVKEIPIIAMTANAFAEDVREAKNSGMNEHIAKPLDFDQLLKALNHWLG